MTDSSAALLEVAATVDPARPATSARRGRKRRGPDDSRRGIVWRVIVAVVVSAIVIFPLYWMCVVAFSPRGEVFEPGLHLIPSTFTLENFQNVLSQYPVFTWFGNSVVIGVFVTVFTVIVKLLAGYAFARLRFRGRNAVFLLALATMMIPVQAIMVAQFKLTVGLGIFGSYWGVSAMINDTAVMDDAGNLLGDGEVGEIVHRGPNVMEGYFKNPKATDEARAHGWHHTGDLGMWVDAQLMFKDRKKDMIKTGGENVPSIKVEAVLLRHPAVANAAAIGLPHARWIEAVTAVVVRRPGAEVSEEELLQHCREHLGGFEVPKAVVFVDALPMTSTGKIQKHPLRQQLQTLYADRAG